MLFYHFLVFGEWFEEVHITSKDYVYPNVSHRFSSSFSSVLLFSFALLGGRGMEIGFLGKGDIFHLDIKYTQKQKALLISKHMD